LPALPTLTIGVLAQRSGSSVPTVRYYEEIGLVPKAKRGPGGHRLYDESDLKRLTFVRRCRDFALPIEKIRELVSLMNHPAQDCSKARDVAELQLCAQETRGVESIGGRSCSLCDRLHRTLRRRACARLRDSRRPVDRRQLLPLMQIRCYLLDPRRRTANHPDMEGV
jgi:DNA-binding transcriptional MerR regulator